MGTQSTESLAKIPTDEEEYYRRLWWSDHWRTGEPHEDERLRGESIMRLIERFVLPVSKQDGAPRILDLGCGRGWLTRLLVAYGETIGADPVSAGIERAKGLFPELDFRRSDAAGLLSSLGPGYFDLVVSSEVIEHVVDAQKQAFLKSIKSLLAPGGFAILTTPRADFWDQWKRLRMGEQPVEQWISEAALEQLSLSAGFRVVAKDRVFVPWFSYGWLSRIATSRLFSCLISRFPHSKILQRVRYHCGLYQVIVLQRA